MSDPRWPLAVRAARCLALDPVGLGGLHLRARASEVRDAVLALGPTGARLHPDIADDALFGGLDLAETLRTGRPVARAGLLARHEVLTLTMAERTPPGLAARLGRVLDDGGHALIALDEGVEDEGLPRSLVDRMALSLDLDGLRHTEMPGAERLPDGEAVAAGEALVALTGTALTLGIASLRAPPQALRVARASARLDGRADVTEADLAFAVAVSLAPKATRLPEAAPEADPEAPADPPPPDEAETRSETIPQDVLLEAARAVLPPDLLARLAASGTVRATGTGAGARRKGNRRGRPLPPRPGRPDGRSRIDLVATLRQAAPWQRLRGGGPGSPVRVRGSDLRFKRYESRSDRLLIFAVDASGSAAFARLAEAKGAVELLLAEAYARRDHVALLAFRGAGADLLLPPTRSLVRTKRELAGLPGGGGTPLAAALRDGATLARRASGRGMDPALVVLTDGRPNIALSGQPDRAEARADAEAMSRAIRATGLSGLVIDTGARPSAALADLAARMGAPCLPLPRADAHGLSRAVAQAL
ncbi:MAG: magnesium chelatase subunit D [Pseudomonadota bacterium]